MRKNILKYFSDKKSEHDTYFKIQGDDVLTLNLRIFRMVSIVSLFGTIILMVIANFLLDDWKITHYHYALIILILIHVAIAVYLNEHRLKHKVIEKLFCVTFSLSVFILLICIDTLIYPDKSQVFSSSYVVIAPAIFIMSLSRMVTDQIFFVIVYAFFAFNFKDKQYAVNDLFMIFVGCVFGCVLYAITFDLRLKANSEMIRLKTFSETDELTGILNRRAANAQINYWLEQNHEDEQCALIMMDVDFFKTINDTFGHKKGDNVLQEVANVLSTTFRKNDVVSRFGGDEFLIFISGFTDETFLERKCLEIQGKMKNVLKSEFSVTCSIGACIKSSSNATMDDLVKHADEALYETKIHKKGKYTIIYY